eukprot:m.332798 g.332798  ORF g.332798 m.332798 type:complete len:261 (+) comp17008_c0_seq1:110-892(+)
MLTFLATPVDKMNDFFDCFSGFKETQTTEDKSEHILTTQPTQPMPRAASDSLAKEQPQEYHDIEEKLRTFPGKAPKSKSFMLSPPRSNFMRSNSSPPVLPNYSGKISREKADELLLQMNLDTPPVKQSDATRRKSSMSYSSTTSTSSSSPVVVRRTQTPEILEASILTKSNELKHFRINVKEAFGKDSIVRVNGAMLPLRKTIETAVEAFKSCVDSKRLPKHVEPVAEEKVTRRRSWLMRRKVRSASSPAIDRFDRAAAL